MATPQTMVSSPDEMDSTPDSSRPFVKRNIVANDIYDIGSSINPIYGFAVNHSCKDSKKISNEEK